MTSDVITEVPGYDCSIDELMVVAFSHALRTDTRAFNGAVSFIPACAFMLARATHAPDLVWAAGSIGIDAMPDTIPESTLSDGIWKGSTMLANSPFDFWPHAQGARYNTFSFRGAQIDKFGNVNNTVIGDYDTPRVRLAGGGGMADLSVMIPRIMLWSTTHTRRTFVDRVDFRSGLGYGDGGNDRERRGIAGGPVTCITNLCVFGFDPATKHMRVDSLHPGVTFDDVQAATGFVLAAPTGDAPVTAAPTAAELYLLRTVIDPHGARRREFA
jgi:glutaconate CoA-transferase subunit B